jgi:uncharacterized protein (TIGR00251 family)
MTDAPQQIRVWITVQPGKRETEVFQPPHVEELLVRVKEPPKEGKANKAVRIALAHHFGTAPSNVRIIKGLRSRRKLAEIAIGPDRFGPQLRRNT